jgi:hypothetical protein
MPRTRGAKSIVCRARVPVQGSFPMVANVVLITVPV